MEGSHPVGVSPPTTSSAVAVGRRVFLSDSSLPFSFSPPNSRLGAAVAVGVGRGVAEP
jgi:hypothetical protein